MIFTNTVDAFRVAFTVPGSTTWEVTAVFHGVNISTTDFTPLRRLYTATLSAGGAVNLYTHSIGNTTIATSVRVYAARTGSPSSTEPLRIRCEYFDNSTSQVWPLYRGFIHSSGGKIEFDIGEGWRNQPRMDTAPLYLAAPGIPYDVQDFTTAGSHTWTKPTTFDPTWVLVFVTGGGGGGGGGCTRNAATGYRQAACGGGGGATNMRLLRAVSVPATVPVTVGAGGAGGAGAPGSGDGDGADGSDGGSSAFGSPGSGIHVFAGGGGGGRRGRAGVTEDGRGGGGGGFGGSGTVGGISTTTRNGGPPGDPQTPTAGCGSDGVPTGSPVAGQVSEWGGAGGAGHNSTMTTYLSLGSTRGGGGGGLGAGTDSSGVLVAATAGGVANSFAAGAAGSSGASPTAGGNGGDYPSIGTGGSGGGGGGGTVTLGVSGANGGNGGIYGGGGGGGGCGRQSGGTGGGGAGGNGARGRVYVFTW